MHSISAFILGEESTRGPAAGLTLMFCSQLRSRGFTHRNISPENKLRTAGMSTASQAKIHPAQRDLLLGKDHPRSLQVVITRVEFSSLCHCCLESTLILSSSSLWQLCQQLS